MSQWKRVKPYLPLHVAVNISAIQKTISILNVNTYTTTIHTYVLGLLKWKPKIWNRLWQFLGIYLFYVEISNKSYLPEHINTYSIYYIPFIFKFFRDFFSETEMETYLKDAIENGKMHRSTHGGRKFGKSKYQYFCNFIYSMNDPL